MAGNREDLNLLPRNDADEVLIRLQIGLDSRPQIRDGSLSTRSGVAINEEDEQICHSITQDYLIPDTFIIQGTVDALEIGLAADRYGRIWLSGIGKHLADERQKDVLVLGEVFGDDQHVVAHSASCSFSSSSAAMNVEVVSNQPVSNSSPARVLSRSMIGISAKRRMTDPSSPRVTTNASCSDLSLRKFNSAGE